MASAPDTSPPTASPARPEARSFRVDELVRGVLAGRIRVPEFPRGIHWDEHDALVLIDSLDRGYPVGALLLWQRPAPAARIVHGGLTIDVPACADALWVVDGQQRLLSLLRLFTGAGLSGAVYDLASAGFKRLPHAGALAPRDLPLTEVLDPSRLVEWLHAHPAAGPWRQAALQLGERLRESPIPAHVVTTPDERIVRDIFRRINRVDKRMHDREAFDALRDVLAPADLREVSLGLADLDFGPLDEPVLHDMLLATHDLSRGPSPSAFVELARCAREVVRFLRDDAGIPHVSLLPVPAVLVVLARFLCRHREPHPRSRELLARWVWRHALTSVRADDPARLQRQLAAIGDDEHATVQALLRLLPARPSPARPTDDLAIDAPAARLARLALLALGPRDLIDGGPVAPLRPGEPDAYLRLLRPVVPLDRAEARGLANHVFHPREPADLARAVVTCGILDLLASHAVAPDARRALERDDVATFLKLRGAELRAQIEAHGERRAQWDEPDTPPVAALQLGSD